MKTWKIILAWAVCCASFVCPGLAQSTPAQASYRVVVSSANSAGSATGINPTIAVTNAHVAQRTGNKVTLKNFVSGSSATGIVIAIDRKADLALIKTNEPIDWVWASQTGVFSDDAKLHRYSYGSGRGTLVKIACKILHRRSHSNDGKTRFTTTSVKSQPGDSGGGIFQHGMLVGTLWGSNFRTDTVGAESNYLYTLCSTYDNHYQTRLKRIFKRCPPGG